MPVADASQKLNPLISLLAKALVPVTVIAPHSATPCIGLPLEALKFPVTLILLFGQRYVFPALANEKFPEAFNVPLFFKVPVLLMLKSLMLAVPPLHTVPELANVKSPDEVYVPTLLKLETPLPVPKFPVTVKLPQLFKVKVVLVLLILEIVEVAPDLISRIIPLFDKDIALEGLNAAPDATTIVPLSLFAV